MILLLLSTISATSDTYHTYCALRHGQSLANVAGVISSDPRVACIEHGLSDAGRAQADAAAADVVAAAIEEGVAGVAIVASDLRRAWQTASIVRAHVLAAGVRVWPAAGKPFEERALRERSFGELSGQSDERYHEVWVHDAESATHEEFDVESIRSVNERARLVVDGMERALPRDRGRWLVVLVAHGDVLQIAQTAFADVDPRTHRSLEHLPTATLRRLHAVRWRPCDEAAIDPRWREAARWPYSYMDSYID